VAELHGIRIATVFAADAQLDARTGRCGPSSMAIFTSWPTPVWSSVANGFFLKISFSV